MTEKPPTVGWELRGNSELLDIESYENIADSVKRVCDIKIEEKNELIRRSDVREHYGGETFSIGHWIDIGEYRERQRIIEMLEDMPVAIRVKVTDNNDLEMKFPGKKGNPLVGFDWDDVVLISKEDLKQKLKSETQEDA